MFSSLNTIFQFWRKFWQKSGTKNKKKKNNNNNNDNNNSNKVILKIAYALLARDQKLPYFVLEVFANNLLIIGLIIRLFRWRVSRKLKNIARKVMQNRTLNIGWIPGLYKSFEPKIRLRKEYRQKETRKLRAFSKVHGAENGMF